MSQASAYDNRGQAFGIQVWRGHDVSSHPWCWRVVVHGEVVKECNPNERCATAEEAAAFAIERLQRLLDNRAAEAVRDANLVAGSCATVNTAVIAGDGRRVSIPIIEGGLV